MHSIPIFITYLLVNSLKSQYNIINKVSVSILRKENIMTGSIQEKNGKYYTVLNIKDKNGKYKKKWQTTGLPVKGNKRKAEQILRRRIAEYDKLHTVHGITVF